MKAIGGHVLNNKHTKRVSMLLMWSHPSGEKMRKSNLTRNIDIDVMSLALVRNKISCVYMLPQVAVYEPWVYTDWPLYRLHLANIGLDLHSSEILVLNDMTALHCCCRFVLHIHDTNLPFQLHPKGSLVDRNLLTVEVI